jgi:hypothetical protein
MTFERPALICWVVTAVFGFLLLGTWVSRGGLAQQPRGGHFDVGVPPPYFPTPLIVGHFLLAAGGLATWIGYLWTGRWPLAWVAFAILGPVDLLGLSMFGRWVGSRRMRRMAVGVPVVQVDPESRLPVLFQRPPAESRLPLVLVFTHGLLAGTTVLLVFLATIHVHLS